MAIDPKSIPYVVNRFGSTTLLEDILPEDTTIQLVNASSLPEGDRGGCIQIKTEIILFERRVGDTLYGCRRGLDGSEAASHRRGDIVTSKIVALSFNNMKDAVVGLDSRVSNLKRKEVITLTQDMILLKAVTLSAVPAPASSVEVIPAGGFSQMYGVDYDVSGSNLIWGNLGLEEVLEAGDEIMVIYNKL